MSTELIQAYRQLTTLNAKHCRCRKFHLFRYLPVEIRLQIWKFALPLRPRTICLDSGNNLARLTYHRLLRACRESNRVVIRALPVSILTFDARTLSWSAPTMSINPDLDMFFLAWGHILPQRLNVPINDPLMHLRHIAICGPEFNYPGSRLMLRRCVNIQTISLIMQVAPCGGRRELYDLVGGVDPSQPTETPSSIRLPLQQETYTKFMEPNLPGNVTIMDIFVTQMLRDLQHDVAQGLLPKLPTIVIRGLKYMQPEVLDWPKIRNWMRGLLELLIFTRVRRNRARGHRYKICSKKPCFVCIEPDRLKRKFHLYPVFHKRPKLPTSIWTKIWKMAAPAEALKEIESFFAHSGVGNKSLGASESLQVRLQRFNQRSRLVTIGLYEADMEFTSFATIQFNAEAIFGFWDMSKWRTLAWIDTPIESWDADWSFARWIKNVEMKSGDIPDATAFASSEVALRMPAVKEVVIVLGKVLGSNILVRHVTQV